MNKKTILKIILIFSVILSVVWLIVSYNKNGTILTNAQSLSNTKIEWGIKRGENNKQPDIGSTNKKIMDQNNGIYMGNKDKKIVYLTFDLGYEAGYTDDILNTLKENNVTATFFITAHYVNTASDLIQKMIDNGNIVGNHTVNHKSMPSLNETTLEEEIMKLHDAIKEKFNYEMKYIRPPKGEYSEKSVAFSNSLGYQTVMWSFAYADWDEKNQPSKDTAIKKIIENLHNGEIMLLHATSKTNKDVLDEVIKQIKDKGYEIKSLNEFEM